VKIAMVMPGGGGGGARMVVRFAAGLIERAVLSVLLALVWGAIAVEGWVWGLRQRPRAPLAGKG